MPSILVKATPERDLYCLWSSVVDNVTWIGARDEALRREPIDRVERADKHGSSVILKGENAESIYTSREGGWTDNGFVVTNIIDSPHPFYWLPRANLAAYLDAVMADNDDAMYAALAPIPTED
jgi:hypothetical protein